MFFCKLIATLLGYSPVDTEEPKSRAREEAKLKLASEKRKRERELEIDEVYYTDSDEIGDRFQYNLDKEEEELERRERGIEREELEEMLRERYKD
jgi:hypothetical protein